MSQVGGDIQLQMMAKWLGAIVPNTGMPNVSNAWNAERALPKLY